MVLRMRFPSNRLNAKQTQIFGADSMQRLNQWPKHRVRRFVAACLVGFAALGASISALATFAAQAPTEKSPVAKAPTARANPLREPLKIDSNDNEKPVEKDEKPVEKDEKGDAAASGLGLPMPGTTKAEPVDADAMLKELGYQDPVEKVRNTLADPPGAKRLSDKSSLWIDVKQKRVYIDGYVSLRDAPLEMFACPAGTKEHESIVGTLARAKEVHAALLAIGAAPGTPVKFQPNYVPATGQRIRVWVMYRDAEGKFQYTDARKWVRKGETKESLETDWVFAGSVFWTDPADGKNYYQADSGELICVSNFGTAMMDLPVESSASNEALNYMAFTDRIPADTTPVRLMLVPIPSLSDQPADPKSNPPQPDKVPDESLMPLKAISKAND